jgi:hypothetical protein
MYYMGVDQRTQYFHIMILDDFFNDGWMIIRALILPRPIVMDDKSKRDGMSNQAQKMPV